MIHIAYALIDDLPEEKAEELSQQLPVFMQDQMHAYAQTRDRQLYLYGKLLLQKLFAKLGVPPSVLTEIKQQQGQKPQFQPPFDFNISHSGNMAICALTTDASIGIDVELIRDINLDTFRKLMTEQEYLDMSVSAHPQLDFFNWWCQKESVMKATGQGFALKPQSIEIDEHQSIATVGSKEWYLQPVDLSIDYIGWVCCSRIDVEVEIELVEL